MKKFIIELSLCLLVMFIPITCMACDNKNNQNQGDQNIIINGVVYLPNYNYQQIEEYVVVGFRDSVESVTIKSNINNKPVNKIYANAFKGSLNLREVTIPKSVNVIGKNAFNNCKNLTTVNFEQDSSLETISVGAFANCSSLTSFTLPSSVKNLEKATKSSEGIFYKSKINTFIFEPNETLTELPEYLFYDSDLNVIDLSPLKITKIGQYAFAEAPIEDVKLNKELEKICSNAFYKSSKSNWDGPYVTLTIPKNVSIIESYAFYNAYFKTVVFETGSELTEIANNCFEDSRFTFITIPKSVKKIGHEAFTESRIESVMFESESELKIIAARAFYDCEYLESVEFPESIEYIGNNAFRYTPFLDNNMSKVIQCKDNSDKYVFLKANYNLEDLSSIVGFEGVRVIANNAFYDCNLLESLDLSECSYLVTIGEEAFFSAGVKYVVIPESVTYIGCRAFDNNLTTIEIKGVLNWIAQEYDGIIYNDEYFEDKFIFYKNIEFTIDSTLNAQELTGDIYGMRLIRKTQT